MKKLLYLIVLGALILSSFIPAQAVKLINNMQVIERLSSNSLIQLNDGGMSIKRIIAQLIDKGYLIKGYKSAIFSEEMQKAVISFQSDNDLECTGMMDNETLTLLLQGRKETQCPIYVFIPTDGGKRYHGNPFCSGMTYPRVVTLENAKALGFTQCHAIHGCKEIFTNTAFTDDIDEEVIEAYLQQFTDYLQSYLKDRNAENLTITVQETAMDDDLNTSDRSHAGHSETETEEQIIMQEYIGNKKTHVFHNPSCASVSDMKAINQVLFSSREEAIQNDYKPCGRCSP